MYTTYGIIQSMKALYYMGKYYKMVGDSKRQQGQTWDD